MPLYICPRCRYSTPIKTHIKNHFKRKKKCKAIYNDISTTYCLEELDKIKYRKSKSSETIMIEKKKEKPITKITSSSSSSASSLQKKEFICQRCDKCFTRNDNMKRHSLICKIEKTTKVHEKNTYTKSEVATLVENMNHEYDKKVKINEAIINELRHQVNLLMQNQGSNITYNTNIMLNAFGKENTKYIDDQLINKLIDQGPLNSISLLLKHIHFNPDHIENHNIRIPNKKDKFAKIFNGHDWQISDKKQTIDHMTDNAYAMINQHYIKDNKHMDSFIDKYDSEDSKINKRVHSDTEIMILNNQTKKG